MLSKYPAWILLLLAVLFAGHAPAQTPVPKPSSQFPKTILTPKIVGIDILEAPMFVTNDPNRLFRQQVANMRVRLDRGLLSNTTLTLGVEYTPTGRGNVLIVPATRTVPAGATTVLFNATADIGASTLNQPVNAVVLANIGSTLGSAPFRGPTIKIVGGNPPSVPAICNVPTGLGLAVSPLAPRGGDVVTIQVSSSCAPRGGSPLSLSRLLPQGTTLTNELSASLSAAAANEPSVVSIPAYRTIGTKTYTAGTPTVDVPRVFRAFFPINANISSNVVNLTYKPGACNPVMRVAVSPGAISPGGTTTATVSLSCALGQNLVVQVLPVSTTVVFPQGTLTIPAGALSGSGAVVALPSTRVGTQVEVRAIAVNPASIAPATPVILIVP